MLIPIRFGADFLKRCQNLKNGFPAKLIAVTIWLNAAGMASLFAINAMAQSCGRFIMAGILNAAIAGIK